MGHLNMDELRKKAIHIGNVTEEYVVEIEDITSEEGVALFSWTHREDEELGIWIELAADGRLIRLSKDINSSNHGSSIYHEKELKDKALDFVEKHYPRVNEIFTLEEWGNNGQETYKLVYVQIELDLPLPLTGFSITIALSGEITYFRYDGTAENIDIPESILSKEEIRIECINGLEMKLLISEISKNLYVEGDDQLHLVYEPTLPFYSYSVDGIKDEFEYEEEEEPREYIETIVRPSFREQKTINELIGFDENEFEQIRELDLGNVTGSVWRIKNNKVQVQEDKTIEGYFNKRNDNTLKIQRDNETGKILGVFSFLEREGELGLTKEESKEVALQLLFILYPSADLYFRYVVIEEEDEEDTEEESKNFRFEFRIFHEGIDNRLASARVSVNRTTGFVDHYLAPDVDPEALKNINTIPAVTAEEASNIFKNELSLELKWNKEYKDNQESYYALSYVISFPKLRGRIDFINAQTGEKIVNKL
ncbi:YcdB/YcdC domain-containing protein [Bacillus sp. DJP31]|uniref:YcdB/YcdC domain-containing protein n=1 Tax=Bacillus sp. DJP31 TaxID=3409789 RepID=UPI003BB6BCBB